MTGEPEFDLSRREFMLAGTTSMLGLNSNLQQQLDTTQDTSEYKYRGVADLLGPERARPEPGSEFFEDKIAYAYRYEATDTGDRFFITDDDSQWIPLTMIPTNQLDEVETQDARSFFNHTFARPEAPDTKNWNFDPANVTKVGSEVELASTASLDTTQRGNYPPGSEATPGVAFRVTDTPTGGEGYAGYASSANGIIAGEDTTDSFVEIRRNSDTHRVHRSDWNGFIPDSRVWVSNRPIITRMPHLFYGGGDLAINALIHGKERSELRTLHTFTPDNVPFSDGAPIDQPNLPVLFESKSLTGANVRGNASHYQFSLAETENRVNGIHYGPTTVSTTGWTMIAGWQKRSGWEMVNVRPLKISVTAETNPVRVELQLNPALSSVSTALPTHTSSSETAVQEITSATVDSAGERRWVGYAPAGQGNATDSISADSLSFNLPVNQPVALFAQAVGGDSTVSGAVAWEEYF